MNKFMLEKPYVVTYLKQSKDPFRGVSLGFIYDPKNSKFIGYYNNRHAKRAIRLRIK